MQKLTWLGPLIAALVLGACASQPREREPGDPLERINRISYRINDLGDRYLVRPVAVGYTHALPPQLRAGIRNFFDNALYPVTIANVFLQGKFAQTGRDGARFLVNSTIGLAGLFDPATRLGLEEHDEDFGQTLGVWGVPEGPYLVIPLFGPRTLRHGFGDLVDSPLTPYVQFEDGNTDVALGLWALDQVDRRARLLEADEQVYAAFDPYLFVRDAYLQNQRYELLDGNVPEDDSIYEEVD